MSRKQQLLRWLAHRLRTATEQKHQQLNSARCSSDQRCAGAARLWRSTSEVASACDRGSNILGARLAWTSVGGGGAGGGRRERLVLRPYLQASHKITIDGFKPSKNIVKGWCWVSKPFDVCGHAWRIKYYPHGNDVIHGRRHISLFLELHPAAQASDVRFAISLLDQSGNPVRTRAKTEPLFFCSSPSSSAHGFDEFITWNDLEDDRFAIRCDIITSTMGSAHDDDAPAAAAAAPVPVPPSDLHEQLTRLLWKDKRGADVTVDVGGGEPTFDAHGWLLAARSPVLEAELLASSSNSKKEKSGGAHRRIEIQGVEPKVFEAMLQYMYTDALPDSEDDDAMSMAHGLLAAAHRFNLERLKLMCEETLAKRIDVSTVADTLAVAEQHGCSALKAACMEFMARPGKLKAVMGTGGYDKIIKDKKN